MKKSSKSHRSLIVFLTLALAFLVPRAALASEVSEMYEAEVNGYQVSMGFVDEIKTGENNVHVKLSDPQGQPATPSEVKIMLMRIEEDTHTVTDSHSAAPSELKTEHGSMPGMEMNSEPATENDHQMLAGSTEESDTVLLEAGHEIGEYKGVLKFEKSGNWNVVVHFIVEDRDLEVEFPVTVVGTFSKNGVLAGIFALNVAIVSTAAVCKRSKTSKAP